MSLMITNASVESLYELVCCVTITCSENAPPATPIIITAGVKNQYTYPFRHRAWTYSNGTDH